MAINLKKLYAQLEKEQRASAAAKVDPTANLEFLPSTADRVPMVKDWGKKGGLPYAEATELSDTIQLIVPKGIVVLDFDDPDHAETAIRIVQDKNLSCRIVRTLKGVHLYFNSTKTKWRNKTAVKSHIGLVCDWKVGYRNGLATVLRDGTAYEVVRDVPVLEVSELPPFFEPAGKETPDLFGMKEGDGRNEALFAHIGRMGFMGLGHDQAMEAAEIINKYIFAQPLKKAEFQVATRDEAFADPDQVVASKYFDDKGKFAHDLLAHDLAEQHHIITRNDRQYLYDPKRGYYRLNNRGIQKLVIDVFPRSLKSHRSEVVDYIANITDDDLATNGDDLRGDERFTVNCLNGRLNLRTGTLHAHTPLAKDFTQIPVKYDPDATCETVTTLLDKVFVHDNEMLKLFAEILGYCLMRTSEHDSFFIFTGEGSNGKSTVLNMIEALVGEQNTTSLSLQQLEDRFSPAHLEHMLVNIGDDIGTTSIRDTGMLKKLAGGERVNVERKGQQGFSMKSYATLLYSANDIPHIADNSEGMKRRMVILPFEHTFTKSDPDYDPAIEQKATTPEGLSTLLNLATEGAGRLIRNNKFTLPTRVIEAGKQFQRENSGVVGWFEDREVDNDWLRDKPCPEVYADYVAYCKEIGKRIPMSPTSFGRAVKRDLNFDRLSARINKRVTNSWTILVPEDESEESASEAE